MEDNIPFCEVMDIINSTRIIVEQNMSFASKDWSYLHVSTMPPSTAFPPPADTMSPSISLGWFEVVLLCLCVIGVSGNILNLIVLTRRRFCSSLNKLESSANYGLVALAISDLCFCLVVLPHVFLSGQESLSIQPAKLFYRIFGVATINVFLMTSTWVIIIIAINRCIVVVYPLKAKYIVSRYSTVIAISIVYMLAVVLTLPYYLKTSVRKCKTPTGVTNHEYYEYFDEVTTNAMRVYIRWIWPIIADFIPLLILVFCNIRLVYEIKKSSSDKAICRRSSQKSVQSNSSKVTVTLVSIIVMYLCLVTPCEIMKYINPYQSWGQIGYIIANATNALQTANFAFNFVVYCVVNSTFRQTLKDLIRPSCSNSSNSSIKSTNHSELKERQMLIVRRNSENMTLLTTV